MRPSCIAPPEGYVRRMTRRARGKVRPSCIPPPEGYARRAALTLALHVNWRWWKRWAGVDEVCTGGGQRVGRASCPSTAVHGLCTRGPKAIVHTLAKRAGACFFSKQETH